MPYGMAIQQAVLRYVRRHVLLVCMHVVVEPRTLCCSVTNSCIHFQDMFALSSSQQRTPVWGALGCIILGGTTVAHFLHC
jgi:hypothetical protein